MKKQKPIIPIIAGFAIAAGSAALAWYQSLSKEEKDEANAITENILVQARSKLSREQVMLVLAECSGALYGTKSIPTLNPVQKQKVKEATTVAIERSNNNVDFALEIARKMKKNNS